MPAPSIQAIPTTYKQIQYRSRLEARWAVFFDHMGIATEYEKEGFWYTDEAGKRRQYLPDFYLPYFDAFAEVKPEQLEPQVDYLKCQEFLIQGMGKKVIFLVGRPDFTPYMMFRRMDLPDGSESWITDVCLDTEHNSKWHQQERRFYEGLTEEEYRCEQDFSRKYRHAVVASRNCKFDGSELPADNEPQGGWIRSFFGRVS